MKNLLFITLLVFGASFASAQSKVAHLNSQEIMSAMPSYNLAVKKLETFQRESNEELQVMIADFEAAVKIYQDKVNTYSPVIRQSEEDKLAKKQQAVGEREQSIQREVEAYSRELNLPIIARVEEAVKTVSDNQSYDYVFDVSMVMIHTGPDITKDVITEILKLENEAIVPPPMEVIRP